MFGNREQRYPSHKRGVKSAIDFEAVGGRFLQVEFDDDKGGYWQLDLTGAYEGVQSVKRTVVHLFPGFVAVLDEGNLDNEEDISLRWHTINPAQLGSSGAFYLTNEGICLAGQIDVQTGMLTDHRLMRHEYQAPFHKDRAGDLLDQRWEPYLETRLHDKHYRILSLFALVPKANAFNQWISTNNRWAIRTQDGDCAVHVTDKELLVSSESLNREWKVDV